MDGNWGIVLHIFPWTAVLYNAKLRVRYEREMEKNYNIIRNHTAMVLHADVVVNYVYNDTTVNPPV